MDIKLLENFKAVRFGQGAISKLVGALFAVSALGAFVTWNTPDLTFRYVVFGALVVCFLVVAALSVYFIEKHPEAALVEGASAVSVYRMVAEAKGLSDVIVDDAILPSPRRALSEPMSTDTGDLAEDDGG